MCAACHGQDHAPKCVEQADRFDQLKGGDDRIARGKKERGDDRRHKYLFARKVIAPQNIACHRAPSDHQRHNRKP